MTAEERTAALHEPLRLLRQVLDGLTDDECFQIADLVPPLGHLAAPAGAVPSRADRRQKPPKVRKLLRNATPDRLSELLEHVLHGVSHQLARRGFTEEQIAHPDLAGLRTMIGELSPLVARLSVLGLLMTDQPATALARRHAAEMLALVGLRAGDPVDGHTPPAVDDVADGTPSPELDWAHVRATVGQLSEQATALAVRLRADADAVEGGRVPEDHQATADVLAAFAERLDGLLTQVTDAAAAGEVTDLAAVLHIADAIDAEREQRQHALAELLAERAGLEQSLRTAPPTRRAAYQLMLDDVKQQISQISGTPQPTVTNRDEPQDNEEGSRSSASIADRAKRRDDHCDVAERKPDGPSVASASTAGGAIMTEPVPITRTAQPEPTARCLDHDASEGPREFAAAIPPAPEPQPSSQAAQPSQPIAPVSVTVSDRDLQLAFPWDEGSPPPVVELVTAGRLAEAYWTTAASDEPTARRDALRFAAAAFAARGTTAATEALRLDAGVADDREAVLVETAALLRCSLVTGWSHRFPHLDSTGVTLPPEWSALVMRVSSAVQQGYRVELVGNSDNASDAPGAVTELRDTAHRLRDELPNRRNTYQRATRVQQRMLRDNQPLGRLLELVIAWADGATPATEIQQLLHEHSGPEAVDQLIDAADNDVRTVAQRGPIVAGSRRHLQRTVTQVIELAREAVALAATLAAPSDSTDTARRELRLTSEAALASGSPSGVGGACLGLLARFVVKPWGPAGQPAVGSAEDVSTTPLLLLPDLPRRSDRSPDVADPLARQVIAALRGAPDAAAAFARYCDTGALDLASRLLAEDDAAGTEADLREAVARWEAVVVHLRDRAEALLDRLRLQDEAYEDVARFAGRLGALPNGAAAYDVVLNDLEDLRTQLQLRLDEHLETLRERISAEVRDSDLRVRIDALLDQHDTATVHEFLAMNRAGVRIPASEADPVEALGEFVLLLDDDSDASTIARRLLAPGERLSEASEQGLAHWADLAVVRETRLRVAVEGTLRLLGLDVVKGSIERLRIQRRDVLGFEVRAVSRDGSHVTELGSGARGRYKVLVVRDDRRGRSPLDDLDTAAVDVPYLVLYLQPMGTTLRATIAADARRRRTNAIVIDPTVIGWIAARAPGSFRHTQRLTLPWAAFEPYRPYVAGRVPRELFVGREDERRRIVDPGGGMFVYGGRQLGKSALLRHVESEPGDHRTVVYLDLKGLGIGEAEEPDQIWVALSNELKVRGVFSSRVSTRPDPSTVAQQVRRWLDEDDPRQLLVLADEADAFLTADSRGTPTSGGMQYFPNMVGLKHLMESTDRRFKIVFAGLHQVQRFDRLSNVPTPHGGPSILIGPLEPTAARRLVIEPLAALGYRFERPELVWRLLAETNYQPAPIQIFCAELLVELRSRHAPDAAHPVTITAADVERTAESDEVRERIAERLRITINLEDRYRVLALHIARRSIEDRYAAAYDTAGLLEEVRDIWPEGFDASFDESTLAVYLEELVGLGVLVRSPGSGFAVRSPNVVRMLGTREELDRELESSDFDVPYEYNPRLARRLLQRDRGGREKRSPFTDAELQDLVRVAEAGGLPLVTGTEALAVDRLADALRGFVEGRGEELVVLGVDRLKQQVTARGRSTVRWLLLDARGVDPAGRAEALERARAAAGHVVALIDLDAALDRALEGEDVAVPQRWSVETIRSWPDCPYHTPELRRRLIEVTGGWPEIVEAAVQQAQVTSRTEVALGALGGMGATTAQAEALLAGAGVDGDLRAALSAWVGATGSGEVLARGDLRGFLELDDPAFTEFETRLRLRGLVTVQPDGLALDTLTYRCLMTLSGS